MMLGCKRLACLWFLFPQLLDKKKRASVADLSESMECLCYLMRTVGPRLDIPKAKVQISLDSLRINNCSE